MQTELAFLEPDAPAGPLPDRFMDWFAGRGWAPHAHQLALVEAAARGRHALLIAPTGGGKTLALAAAMDNRGTLVASDTDRQRLSQLAPRAQRAGAAIAETVLLDPRREADALSRWSGRADAVLVDAPCSGTGTWRRNPEARWRLSEAQILRYAEAQARLLDIAAGLVGPDGRLVFVTCSLLDAEGSSQVENFLARHPGWQADRPELPLGRPRGQGIRLTPYHDGTDGFFVARLRPIC